MPAQANRPDIATAQRLIMAKKPGGEYEYGKLYRSEEKVYPREVKGRFATLRRLAMFVLLGAFYVGPWLTWDDRQAILFDLPARKFYIFGMTLWPQDFIYLALLLIILAVSLFFFTALAGRLWCGFACPQTVWTEAFTWIEMAIEGDRSKRMKLDKAPWTFDKVRKKVLKQVCWIALALFTGYSFVGYFSDIRVLTVDLVTFERRCLGILLGAVLRIRHLRQCRPHARAGVQVHVSVRALPGRNVRSRQPDHYL